MISQLGLINNSIKNLVRELGNTNTRLDRLIVAVDMLAEKREDAK